MGRVKSDNRLSSVTAGFGTRWYHSAAAETKTITPRSGESVVLHRIIVNTTSATAIIVRDTSVGAIAVLKASVAEGTYTYNLPVKGNLVVENPGGSDLTIVFSDD